MSNKAKAGDIELEPKDGAYVLTRDGSDGPKSLTLTEDQVVLLARLAPTVSRRITASKAIANGEIKASASAPIVTAQAGIDLHGDVVVLRLKDDFGAEFDFSCSPAGAEGLANLLLQFAGEAKATPKTKAH